MRRGLQVILRYWAFCFVTVLYFYTGPMIFQTAGWLLGQVGRVTSCGNAVLIATFSSFILFNRDEQQRNLANWCDAFPEQRPLQSDACKYGRYWRASCCKFDVTDAAVTTVSIAEQRGRAERESALPGYGADARVFSFQLPVQRHVKL